MNLISKIRNFFFACCIYLFYIIYFCYIINRLYYQLLFLDFSEKIREKSWYCKISAVRGLAVQGQ